MKNHTFADTFDRRKCIIEYKKQKYIIMFEIGKKEHINTLYGIESIDKTSVKPITYITKDVNVIIIYIF